MLVLRINKNKWEIKKMIDYNLIMLIGTSLIIGGFLLFIYCEHKIRQCDVADFKNEQLSKSFNKQKEKEKNNI
tara:strand:+ start:945 stop:1163 length:219 start_codon:yes stop_codon:yes gene_type:complete